MVQLLLSLRSNTILQIYVERRKANNNGKRRGVLKLGHIQCRELNLIDSGSYGDSVVDAVQGKY